MRIRCEAKQLTTSVSRGADLCLHTRAPTFTRACTHTDMQKWHSSSRQFPSCDVQICCAFCSLVSTTRFWQNPCSMALTLLSSYSLSRAGSLFMCLRWIWRETCTGDRLQSFIYSFMSWLQTIRFKLFQIEHFFFDLFIADPRHLYVSMWQLKMNERIGNQLFTPQHSSKSHSGSVAWNQRQMWFSLSLQFNQVEHNQTKEK